MKSLGAAIAAALLAVAAAYYSLVELAGLDKPTAAQLASALMAAVPYTRELLDKTVLAREDSRKPAAISIGDFGIQPRRIVLYGTLLVVGAMGLSSGLSLLSAVYIGVTSDRGLVRTFLIVTPLILFPAIFGVGRWVGRRCASHGLAAIFIISFFARLVTSLLDMWWMATATGPFAVFGDFPTLPLRIVAGAAAFSLVGLVGYWRGRRQRVAVYLSYLLQSVSEETRKAIVDLAFEETRATLTRVGRPARP